MIRCVNCGNEIDDDCEVCYFCGNDPLEKVDDENVKVYENVLVEAQERANARMEEQRKQNARMEEQRRQAEQKKELERQKIGYDYRIHGANPLFEIKGNRGRRLYVYEHKCVIKVNVTLGSIVLWRSHQ